jgi:Ca2+-binding EF-hand superfamily protein
VFQRYDRDGNGKVTKAELPNGQTFERFDVNRDGVITQAEYDGVAGGAPAVPGAAGAPTPAAPAAGRAMEWFTQTDRNGDGKLSQAEANSPRFKEFDTDGDGFVTLDEWKARLVGAAAGVQPTAAAGAGAAQATPSPMEWFAQTDRDKDGRLSPAEANSPRFKELDTDADGFVTLAEYKAFLNRTALKQLDKDGDGKISQTEFNALYQDSGQYFRTRQREAQPADGRALPNPLPVKADPLGLRFTQDYVPGTEDPQGRRLAATEANQLVAHRGQLFASFGATYRKPPTPDLGFQGFGVLRKESVNGAWQVDLDLGPRPYRVEVMASVSFTTDAQGRKLEPPVARLVVARWSPDKTIFVRDDAVGKWDESTVVAGPSLPLGGVFTARSFGSHVDRQTGVHHLFAGTWTGQSGAVGEYRSAIYRAAYDPAAATGLRWAVEPELQNVGRIMAMAECNGDLYAACCIFADTLLSGGIFRRIDGPQPRWEQVYRWKEYDLTVWDDEQRMLRGLTAVPDPNGTGREVLIGFRFFPEPVIERIDPQQDHKVSVELNLKDFFGQAFHGGGRYTGTIRCAYNPFTAVTDPRTGETVHLAGVQIYHPGFPNPPHNGSHYLIRHADASYDWAPIYDPAHPVPVGRSLDATRRICVSPFPEDQGRALYFAGYDGPFADNLSAWIYRATMPNPAGQ